MTENALESFFSKLSDKTFFFKPIFGFPVSVEKKVCGILFFPLQKGNFRLYYHSFCLCGESHDFILAPGLCSPIKILWPSYDGEPVLADTDGPLDFLSNHLNTILLARWQMAQQGVCYEYLKIWEHMFLAFMCVMRAEIKPLSMCLG